MKVLERMISVLLLDPMAPIKAKEHSRHGMPFCFYRSGYSVKRLSKSFAAVFDYFYDNCTRVSFDFKGIHGLI